MELDRDLLGFAEFKQTVFYFINKHKVSEYFLEEYAEFIDYNLDVLFIKYNLGKLSIKDSADILEHFLDSFNQFTTH